MANRGASRSEPNLTVSGLGKPRPLVPDQFGEVINERASMTSRRGTWWFANAIFLLYIVIIARFFGRNPLVLVFFAFPLVGALVVYCRILGRVSLAPDRRPWVQTTRDIMEAAERRQKSGDMLSEEK